ncbi:MAG: sensor histidine kinase [Acidobacteriota bacterium]
MPEPGRLAALAAGLAVLAALVPVPWSLAPTALALWIGWRIFKDFKSCLMRSESQKCALDEQLFQSQKLAAIGEIASGIAHEINNPLAVITQEAEWLAHLLGQPEPHIDDARQSLTTIQGQVGRCADITHNLLNLARTWKPIRQPADLNRCVEDMARLVEREARPNNILLVREFAPDLPKVPLDPPLYRQAVLNLLVNAMQAVGPGGTVTVTTGLTPDGKAFTRVADTGPGIAPENLSRVFDPFFTTKAPGKGTGLGLSITQRIVDRLGGLVSVANLPERGAAFTITLPITEKTQ